MTLEQCRETGLGFCPDFSPDKAVGTAMERLLVGSQDVAHDYPRLRELGVTHILNVGVNIPNAFADVRCSPIANVKNYYSLYCLFLLVGIHIPDSGNA